MVQVKMNAERDPPTRFAEVSALGEANQPTSRQAIESDRLSRVKRSYTTRLVDISSAKHILTGGVRPTAGDVVLASVSRLGTTNGLKRRRKGVADTSMSAMRCSFATALVTQAINSRP